MHSIQQLRWRDVLDDILFPSDLQFEWVKLEFSESTSMHNRDGLYVSGPFGVAEATPLPGYFDKEIECVLAAIDTVAKPWPEPKRQEVATNMLVSTKDDIDDSLLGAKSIKVKVKSPGDCETVKFARDFCGSNVNIRIDCNGMFDVEGAFNLLRDLKDVNLELVEQPCLSNQENAELRRKIGIPLAIDETARTQAQIVEAKNIDAADIAVIKVQPSGGIHKAVELIDNWGSDVIIAHMMESQVGIDVGLSLAKSLDKLNYACGLELPKLDKVIREPLDI